MNRKDRYTQGVKWMVIVLFILQIILMMSNRWYGRDEKSEGYQLGSQITKAEVAALYSREHISRYMMFSVTTSKKQTDYWAEKELMFWEKQTGEKINNPDEIADLEMVRKVYEEANSVVRGELYNIQLNRRIRTTLLITGIVILLILFLPMKVGFILTLLLINLLAYVSLDMGAKIGLIGVNLIILLWGRTGIIQPPKSKKLGKTMLIASVISTYLIYGCYYFLIQNPQGVIAAIAVFMWILAYGANLVMLKSYFNWKK